MPAVRLITPLPRHRLAALVAQFILIHTIGAKIFMACHTLCEFITLHFRAA
jgi:hypothetical protein